MLGQKTGGKLESLQVVPAQVKGGSSRKKIHPTQQQQGLRGANTQKSKIASFEMVEGRVMCRWC